MTVSFPEHSLDLDRIDGLLHEPGGPRSFHKVCILLTYQGSESLMLRVELKDAQGGGRFARFCLSRSPRRRMLCWNFRDPLTYRVIGGRDLDIHQAKVLSLVIEREHIADRVKNPERGSLEIKRIWFVPNQPDFEPRDNNELLDILERRVCQYFLDWASRKEGSLGIPQDRSTFGDLLTVGGIGFALPAYITSAERGWIPRSEAITQVLSVLRILDNPEAFGPDRIRRIGHKGWFYHFLGLDGRRKLNFDFPDSPRNEAKNTVELSTIDTGLALMGVLVAQSYFNRDNLEEAEIRSRAQSIYDRVDWPFMLEPSSQQFYLGWKPNEEREGPPFEIPDPAGDGAYSGTPSGPATLDFYTDEAFIVTLLAAGSATHPVNDPLKVHCSWRQCRDETGLIRSYPGSLFTYQFLHAFLDTRTLDLSFCSEDPGSWYENSRKAIQTVIEYAKRNPRRYRTYRSEAWGLSAAEGPDDRYQAFGAPSVALKPCSQGVEPCPVPENTCPEENGTVTYYGMLSSVSFGTDLRGSAIRALRRAWQRGHWHLRFGLPDAFHDEISQAVLTIEPGADNRILRQSGPWVHHALFAINQGPMLLHLENTRSGLIWNLMAQNSNIQRALERLRRPLPPDQILLEGEGESSEGCDKCVSGECGPSGNCNEIHVECTACQVKCRANASGQHTVWLCTDTARSLTFGLTAEASYRLSVRYSNDNSGPMEAVDVSVGDIHIGQFIAQDTGDFGNGWNVFEWSEPMSSVNLLPGIHEVTMTVRGGDGFGVEIDVVKLEREP